MIFTVTQLVEIINTALTPLQTVIVEGEVEEFHIIHNKWVTFKIRDDESSVGCFMPVWQFRTQIEDGMLVRVQGKPTLRKKGFFSFVLSTIQPAGEGALKRAFDLLRIKLTAEGLFATERKRPLPRWPQHIVLITSRDAAAYSDFLKILQARRGGLRVSFLHTQVQGEQAVPQILQAFELANINLDGDVLVLTRGGGSLEDLQAFNDEQVVRAIAASRLPTIVGIGHERDISLAEMAADVRASTPSNAAELLVATREELLTNLRELSARMRHRLATAILQSRHTVAALGQALVGRLKERLAARKQAIQDMQRLLASLSPEAILKRGYSITKTAKGKLVRSARQVASSDELSITTADGDIAARVN